MNGGWALSSSDGWNQISGQVRHYAERDGHDAYFQFEIVVRGRFWQRSANKLGELRDDFFVTLSQVGVFRNNLVGLLAELDTWLSDPRTYLHCIV